MPLNIRERDLNLVYDKGESAEVDIIFVHGLRGHPQKTWEAVDPADPDDRIFWPEALLKQTIEKSRIFTYGYETDFATFYPIVTPESISHLTIDNRSDLLISKLGDFRRETNTSNRPIIFIAHSLGGLVTANALASRYGSDNQSQEVVNHTYGTIFLGTPFKGSSKAHWAKTAKQILGMFGDATDKTIKDLDKRSEKLQQISRDFHLLLQERLTSKDLKPIQVACFFEEKSTTKTWLKIKANLGVIVDDDSATLAGHKPISINADHITMCKFPDTQTSGYQSVTNKIKFIIDSFNKSADEIQKLGQTTITLGAFTIGDNNTNIGGIQNGHVVATVKDAVNQSLTNNWGNTQPGDLATRRAG